MVQQRHICQCWKSKSCQRFNDGLKDYGQTFVHLFESPLSATSDHLIYTWLNTYVDSLSVGEPEVSWTVHPKEVQVIVVLWEAGEHCGAVLLRYVPGYCPLKELEEKCKTLVSSWKSTWKLTLVSRKLERSEASKDTENVRLSFKEMGLKWCKCYLQWWGWYGAHTHDTVAQLLFEINTCDKNKCVTACGK